MNDTDALAVLEAAADKQHVRAMVARRKAVKSGRAGTQVEYNEYLHMALLQARTYLASRLAAADRLAEAADLMADASDMPERMAARKNLREKLDTYRNPTP